MPNRRGGGVIYALCFTRMPSVFTKNGFRFFFYTNDHGPLHVHVRKGGGDAVFDVEPRVRLRESAGMKTTDILRAEELAREYRPPIISKWHEHFD